MKPDIDDLAARLKENDQLSPEIEHLQKYGFFKIRCFWFWYICMVEMLVALHRAFFPIFLTAKATKEEPHFDQKRQMCDVNRKDFLWNLICGPIESMLKSLGLIDVSPGCKREAGACSLLKSLARTKAVFQGFHADSSPFFKWGSMFGLSIITAGSKGGYLDLYPGSFDGGSGMKGIPARVQLQPGESIVFVSTLRHRGGWYRSLNIRLFVSFVVKEAVQLAETDVVQTNELEVKGSDEFVGEVVSFDEWKALKALRH